MGVGPYFPFAGRHPSIYDHRTTVFRCSKNLLSTVRPNPGPGDPFPARETVLPLLVFTPRHECGPTRSATHAFLRTSTPLVIVCHACLLHPAFLQLARVSDRSPLLGILEQYSGNSFIGFARA